MNYLSVSELNLYVKEQLESDFLLKKILVKGEISNLTKHYTGHYYFSLKDQNSIIRVMMFKNYAAALNFDLKEGDEVLILGHLGVYEKQGTYQLYAHDIEQFGLGKYLVELKKLREKLSLEGLFDLPKLPLVKYPKRIGLITSKTGAAVHDMVNTIMNRFPTRVLVFPCLVQGSSAPKTIIKAIKEALNYDLDVLIIGRGGGANEDLIAFNDEELIRLVAKLKIPTISAVGHQIDKPLLDDVASKAANTPTQAADFVTPLLSEVVQQLKTTEKYLYTLIKHQLMRVKDNLLRLSSSRVLSDKEGFIAVKRQSLDQLSDMLINSVNRIINRYQNRLQEIINKTKSPKTLLQKMAYQLDLSKIKLKQTLESIIQYNRNQINDLQSKIHLQNPLTILSKGYGLVYNKNNEVITSLNNLNKDEQIFVQLKDGLIKANITDIIKKEK